MKILILGAGGCFGQNLADYAMKEGHRVIGIGRSPKKPKCFSLGIDFPYYPYHIAFELDYILEKIRYFKPDVIVNYAAQGEGAASWGKDNWRFYNTNVTALVKLVSNLDCHFVQIGSSEVYGPVNSPVSELSVLNPTSPYSVSKLAFDQHLVAMHKVKGFPSNVIRPSNCIVSGQQLHRIVPKALISGLTKRKLPLHGGGAARKSYLHATDLSKAVMKVIERGTLGETYNVGPDQPTSIREVVRLCIEATGVSFEEIVEMAPERTGQDSTYWLDSSKLKALGWKQEISLPEGIRMVLDWVKSYPELLEMDTSFQMRA
jgi:dTDP-glucose 4,6-dehydratase